MIGSDPLGSDRALLVSHGADTYGVRRPSRTDRPAGPRSDRALGLESAQPRPIGRGLLNAIRRRSRSRHRRS
ncbi:hypothetical protein GS415_11895, partial [Rhodococcus hoagii]|nr:hypothetical protein [Prescottella equi]